MKKNKPTTIFHSSFELKLQPKKLKSLINKRKKIKKQSKIKYNNS